MKWIKWLFNLLIEPRPTNGEILFQMELDRMSKSREERLKKERLNQFLLEVLTKGWRNVPK